MSLESWRTQRKGPARGKAGQVLSKTVCQTGIITTPRIIKNHQESSRIIKNHQESSRIIKNHQESPRIIKNHQESSRIIKNHQGSSRIIKNHQGSSRIIKNHQGSSRIIKNHQESSRIIKDHQEWSRIIKDHQEFSRIIKNHQESSGIIENYQESSPSQLNRHPHRMLLSETYSKQTLLSHGFCWAMWRQIIADPRRVSVSGGWREHLDPQFFMWLKQCHKLIFSHFFHPPVITFLSFPFHFLSFSVPFPFPFLLGSFSFPFPSHAVPLHWFSFLFRSSYFPLPFLFLSSSVPLLFLSISSYFPFPFPFIALSHVLFHSSSVPLFLQKRYPFVLNEPSEEQEFSQPQMKTMDFWDVFPQNPIHFPCNRVLERAQIEKTPKHT